MARVKMNSAISSQPAVTGPNTNITIGLAIRNSRITCLYQLGALPRKLRVNPETRVSSITSVLLELAAKKVCNRQPLPALIFVYRVPLWGRPGLRTWTYIARKDLLWIMFPENQAGPGLPRTAVWDHNKVGNKPPPYALFYGTKNLLENNKVGNF